MSELPARWDPRKVAVNRDKENAFLLRPGQLLVGPGDAKDAQAVLTGWKVQDRRTFGVTTFTRTPQNPEDPAREVLDAIARLRKATANRPQGPVRVAPNHVLVGEAGDHAHGRAAPAGRPRLLGAPGQAAEALPLRTTRRGDGKGIKIAVLDTGLFKHDWLGAVQKAAGGGRRLGRRARPVRRQRVRPRHVHRRADPAGRARRRGLRGQGARQPRRRRRR